MGPEEAQIGKPYVAPGGDDEHVSKMTVVVSGEATQRAFTKSCEMYNDEVKTRGYKVPGFRPGAKLPPNYLYQMFGEDSVKRLCGSLLAEDIQDECEFTGQAFVGRGRIVDFREKEFVAGQPHLIDVECDLWPKMTYGAPDGYKGLKCTVKRTDFDTDKYEQVKMSIRERYKIQTATPMGYAAQSGDVIKANMKGYEVKDNGEKGEALPAVAAGDAVEIPLEKGKFMDGLIEGLAGAVAGDLKSITVTFPKRVSGPGVALSGKQALFEVDCLEIMTKEIPEWNEELAASIRDGMTLAELDAEVRGAVEGEKQNDIDNSRNDALAQALIEIVDISRIPDSLVEENTQQRFQQMLMDFKEQGSTDEQLAEMMTPEKYEKYKDISRPNVEKVVKLGMVFRDLAEKEKIDVPENEIEEQMSMIKMQAKQKGEEPPPESDTRAEIENVLLRKKVFDMLASTAEITWIEAPEPVQ